VHTFIPTNLADVPKAERDATLDKLYHGPGFSLWLGSYQDVLSDETANAYVSEFVANKIRQRVKDPKTAEKLIPRDHGFGLKRLPLETRYFEVYNQDNVELVDLNETPIERLTQTGIQTRERLREFDVIIFATGFDAIKGSWNRIDIAGRDGRKLADEWAEGVQTYMGLQASGFPNFFMLVGPQNGATFCNIPRCSALVTDWVTVLMRHARQNGIVVIEPTRQAQEAWTAYCSHLLGKMLLGRTNSWFTGINKNIEGRNKRETLLFLGGNPKFREYCARVEADNFYGFKFKKSG
jgi:(2,2,3-trimethyl-5-oxocyclopent-3-enyl)acetyl-CoA 1,5-monooxygenase